MPYTTQAAVLGDLPLAFFNEALDDDGDGVADEGAWAVVEGNACIRIDGILGQRYPVPFAPVPAIVADSARILVMASLYRRRGVADEKNPWAKAEKDQVTKLNAIAQGEQPLTPGSKKTNPSGAVISEPSGTYLSGGGQLA